MLQSSSLPQKLEAKMFFQHVVILPALVHSETIWLPYEAWSSLTASVAYCTHQHGIASECLDPDNISGTSYGSKAHDTAVVNSSKLWYLCPQGKFKQAACSVMAQANARNYALGLEGVSYEGPLRIRLPVKKRLDDEGSFSFEIPLPNPDRQVLL